MEDLNALKPNLVNTVLSKVFHIPATRVMNHLPYGSVLYLTSTKALSCSDTESLVTLSGTNVSGKEEHTGSSGLPTIL